MKELFEELYKTLSLIGILVSKEIRHTRDPFERAVKLVSSLHLLHPDHGHLLESHAREIADFILRLSEENELIDRVELFKWDSDE